MSHAKTTTPEFVLLAQFPDDTLATIAHWHKRPTLAEIEEMLDLYRKNDSIKWILVKTDCQAWFDGGSE